MSLNNRKQKPSLRKCHHAERSISAQNPNRGATRSHLLDAVALQDHVSRTLKLDVHLRQGSRPSLGNRSVFHRSAKHLMRKPRAAPAPDAAESEREDEWQAQVWTCEKCTLLNSEASVRCAACSSKRSLKFATKERTLAQRRGLVPGPPAPLIAREWRVLEDKSIERRDSYSPCPICCQHFKKKPQVLLSCSHVFHKVCLESFERFVRIQERCCPICRKKDYEKKEVTHGVMAWKNICATKAQAWLRGVLVRKKYKSQLKRLYASGGGDTSSRRKFYADRLQGVTSKLLQTLQRKEDSIDQLFAELDLSVQKSRRVLEHGTSRVAEDEWAGIRQTALAREHVDCSICMTDIPKAQPSKENRRSVVVLKCTHVFHHHCLSAFEQFRPEELNICPVCRSSYTPQQRTALYND